MTTIRAAAPVATRATRRTPRSVVTGRVVTGFVSAFLAFDAISHITQPQVVKDAVAEMGWPASSTLWIGVAMAVSLACYLTPRTNVLGALLITAYLGGAVAANVQIQAGFFDGIMFPVYTAVLVWGGLWLRDPEVRAILPFRR
ncbi:MAG: DoxX family protein [Marmoricola sp.]